MESIHAESWALARIGRVLDVPSGLALAKVRFQPFGCRLTILLQILGLQRLAIPNERDISVSPVAQIGFAALGRFPVQFSSL